jgi:hypothetical protein
MRRLPVDRLILEQRLRGRADQCQLGCLVWNAYTKPSATRHQPKYEVAAPSLPTAG